jgi:ATP-dependent exoDNAse (exonuclease V) beta subunit
VERVRVGDAVHAFFASDSFELDTETRLDLARRISVGFGLIAVPPADLVRAADALHEHVERRWGPATWRREVPIERVLDPDTTRERAVRGVIDLLLETAEGAVILDHKTTDLPEDRWVETPALFGAQLALYADTLRASGQRVRGLAIHLVLAGGLVELREPSD